MNSLEDPNHPIEAVDITLHHLLSRLAERSGTCPDVPRKVRDLELPPQLAALFQNRNTMVVKIRLARFGRRKAPFYNIVVAQARFVPFSHLNLSLSPLSSCS
jgi:hypothetical protein